MFNIDRLCLGCMNDNGGEKICPICSFDSSSRNPENALPLKFVIDDRYVIGKVLSANGEGITYIAWDNAAEIAVNIKEYFPINFANRNPDKTVSMVKGGEYTFNEGLMEFAEINRAIMHSTLSSLIPVTSVFEENGTIYAVSSVVQGITLESFLERNGGTLKWEQARALFLPLIDTISGMNDLGIIHRGISPETIIVGRDGKLRISGYAIKKLRLENSELETEIEAGYAAAEQYGFEGMHDDTYTDVYGLSATIFRVLIGSSVPEATLRLQNDVMTIPSRFAEELPRQVLAALANGLQVLPKERTKNIEAFKNELIYGEIPDIPVRKEKAVKEDEAPKKKGSSAKSGIIAAAITAGVLIIVGTVLLLTVFKDNIFDIGNNPSSSEESSSSAPVVESIGTVESGAEITAKLYKVPDFKGKYYSEIEDNDEYEMFDIIISDKNFSADCPKGTVCSQSVKAGDEVERDTKIELVISLGVQEVKVANLSGLSETEAKLELLKLGFLYENIEVLEKYDEDKKPETVVDQSPKYGEKVNVDTAVKIYINSYKGDETSSEENS